MHFQILDDGRKSKPLIMLMQTVDTYVTQERNKNHKYVISLHVSECTSPYFVIG